MINIQAFSAGSEGAFTGAIADRDGLIETAKGGTLFLDEIGYMDIKAQQALLTFLDTRRV